MSGQAPTAPALEPTVLLGAADPVVDPSSDTPLAGTDSIIAVTLQSEDTLDQAMAAIYPGNANAPAGTMGFYTEQYTYFQSTPYLYILGLPLGRLLADGFFQQTLWAAVLIFLAIAIGSKLRVGAPRVTSLDFFAGLLLKLAISVLILSSPGLIYAAGMTIMNCGTALVKNLRTLSAQAPDGVSSRLEEVLRHTGTADIEMAATRDRAIRNGLADRQGIFTRYTDPVVKAAATDYWAAFFNRLAAAQRSAYPNSPAYTPIPSVDDAPVDDVIGQVITQYTALSLDSGYVDPQLTRTASFTMDWDFGDFAPVHASMNVDPLSDRIKQTTSQITAALTRTGADTQGLQDRAALLKQYERTVRSATSNWVDKEYLDPMAAAIEGEPRLANIVRDIGAWTKREAMGIARNRSLTGALDKWNAFMMGFVTLMQHTVVPVIGEVVCYCFRLGMELSILGLLISIPFWFFDGTAKAFTGAIWTVLMCIVTLPFWQFFQLLLDLLFAGLSTLLTTGSLAVWVAQPELIPDAIISVIFGLTLGYFLAVCLLLYKTPSMVRAFLAGGFWAGQLMATAATGVVAAGMVAVSGYHAMRVASGRGGFLPGLGAGEVSGATRLERSAAGSLPLTAPVRQPPFLLRGRIRRGIREGISMMSTIVENKGDLLSSTSSYIKARQRRAERHGGRRSDG